MLDSASPLPLYAQIAADLEAQINSGELLPQQKLKSEHELSRHFHVGRPTVRQATELLVKRRLVERRRGSGTYVSEQRPELGIFSLDGTLASFAHHSLKAETKLLQGPESRSSSELGKPALYISRLISLSGAPVLFEELEFERAHFPSLKELWNQSSSLSRLVQEQFGYTLESAHQTFSVVACEQENANILQVPVGHPILKVRRRLQFRDKGVLIVAHLYCTTDRMSFTQEIRP